MTTKHVFDDYRQIPNLRPLQLPMADIFVTNAKLNTELPSTLPRVMLSCFFMLSLLYCAHIACYMFCNFLPFLISRCQELGSALSFCLRVSNNGLGFICISNFPLEKAISENQSLFPLRTHTFSLVSFLSKHLCF